MSATFDQPASETEPGLLADVQLASLILRVADLDRSIEWYDHHLGLRPVHRGQDGNTPGYAAYVVGGVVLTMWELPEGQDRHDQDNNRNSYVVLVCAGDIEERRDELVSRGVPAGAMRTSKNNRFFWFHDPDGNRWEVSQPTTEEQADAADEILGRV